MATSGNRAVYLIDADGNVVSADDGTTISNHEGILVAGKDGTTIRFMRVASDGTLRIDPTGTTNQPISASTLPLPTGAATETKLEAVRALLATIDADTSNLDSPLSTLATEAKLEAVRVLLASLDAKDFATETTLLTRATAAAQTDGTQIAQARGDVGHGVADSGAPVKIGGTATSSAPAAVDEGDRVQASFDLQGRLRTDGAFSGTVNITGDTEDLDTGAGTDEHEVFAIGLPEAGGHVVGGTAANPLRTDPTGTTTQPISDGGGSLTVDGPLTDAELRASAVPISVSLVPLPVGAATEATLSDGSQVTQAIGDVAHDAADSGDPVKIGGTATAALPTAVDEGDRVQASFDLQGRLRTATEATVDLNGDQADLDTGAGTDDHEVIAIGLPAPGGHVVGGTATDPLRTDPTGTTTQPVSDGGGSLTVDGPLTDTELRASAVPVSGPLTDTELRATAVPVSGPLTDAELRAAAVPVSAASLPLPSGAATETTLSALNTNAADIETLLTSIKDTDGIKKITDPVAVTDNGGSLTVDGPLTDAELRATAVPVSGPLTDTELRASAVDVSDGGGSLTVDGPLTDAELRASSVPVSLASSPLPTGAATSANQTNGSQVAQAVGDVAHDAADGGAPVKIGGTATAADPTPVDEGDRVQASFDLEGRLRTTASIIGGSFPGDLTDLDSGGGTDDHGVVAIGLPASGGHVVGGTATDPLRTDPTGTTTQPVSAASLPLPSGAATEATLSTLATETKLEAVRALLATIDADTSSIAAEDFATETTLSAANVNLADIETILTAIRDTAGVKKITDPLPAGTNTLGNSILRSATKGTSTAANLTSSNVNANQEALHISLKQWFDSVAPTVGQKIMTSSLPVVLSSDHSPIQVTSGASADTGVISRFLTETGGSENMVVDGSITPVVFDFAADPTDDIQLTSLRLVYSASSFLFDGATFGKGGGVLPNGVDVDIVANSAAFSDMLAQLKVNEDFLRLLSFSISQSGSTDVMAASFSFGGNVQLKAGTGDSISVTVNDDLAGGVRGINYFTATLYGVIL